MRKNYTLIFFVLDFVVSPIKVGGGHIPLPMTDFGEVRFFGEMLYPME